MPYTPHDPRTRQHGTTSCTRSIVRLAASAHQRPMRSVFRTTSSLAIKQWWISLVIASSLRTEGGLIHAPADRDATPDLRKPLTALLGLILGVASRGLVSIVPYSDPLAGILGSFPRRPSHPPGSGIWNAFTMLEDLLSNRANGCRAEHHGLYTTSPADDTRSHNIVHSSHSQAYRVRTPMSNVRHKIYGNKDRYLSRLMMALICQGCRVWAVMLRRIVRSCSIRTPMTNDPWNDTTQLTRGAFDNGQPSSRTPISTHWPSQ